MVVQKVNFPLIDNMSMHMVGIHTTKKCVVGNKILIIATLATKNQHSRKQVVNDC